MVLSFALNFDNRCAEVPGYTYSEWIVGYYLFIYTCSLFFLVINIMADPQNRDLREKTRRIAEEGLLSQNGDIIPEGNRFQLDLSATLGDVREFELPPREYRAEEIYIFFQPTYAKQLPDTWLSNYFRGNLNALRTLATRYNAVGGGKFKPTWRIACKLTGMQFECFLGSGDMAGCVVMFTRPSPESASSVENVHMDVVSNVGQEVPSSSVNDLTILKTRLASLEPPFTMGGPTANDKLHDQSFRNVDIYGILRLLSDARTKTEICEFKPETRKFLNSFSNLVVATFTDINGQHRLGYIAQNVETHFPEAVTRTQLNGQSHLAIDLMAMMAANTKCFQCIARLLHKLPAFRRILRDEFEGNLQELDDSLFKDNDWTDVEDEPANIKKPEAKSDQSPLLDEDLERKLDELARQLGETQNIDHLKEFAKQLGIEKSIDLRDQARAEGVASGKSVAGLWFQLAKKTIKNEGFHTSTVLMALKTDSLYDKARDYQIQAVEDIGAKDSILVMPTGKGKTLIGVLACDAQLRRQGASSCAIVVCQNGNLVDQQAMVFFRDGPPEWREPSKVLFYSGGNTIQGIDKTKLKFVDWKPKGKFESLNSSNFESVLSACKILVVTAGALANNVFKLDPKGYSTDDSPEYDLFKVAILVIDEVHHAVEGNHPFVGVAHYFANKTKAQLLGMSASPVTGSLERDTLHQRLLQLRANLRMSQIVHPDCGESQLVRTIPVKAYSSEMEVEVERCVESLAKYYEAKAFTLVRESTSASSLKLCPQSESFGEKYLEWTYEQLLLMRKEENEVSILSFEILKSVVTSLLIVRDIGAIAALSLVEDIVRLNALYMNEDDDIQTQDVTSSPSPNSSRRMIMDLMSPLRDALLKGPLLNLGDEMFKSTKLETLRKLLLASIDEEGPGQEGRRLRPTLVRVATKRGVKWLLNYLKQSTDIVGDNIKADGIVGKSETDDAKTRKILEQFHRGELNVLIATSAVEEGLDLQTCEDVIAFSVDRLLNSGRSLIQNAGRARRAEHSSLKVLLKDQEEELRLLKMKEQARTMMDLVKSSRKTAS